MILSLITKSCPFIGRKVTCGARLNLPRLIRTSTVTGVKNKIVYEKLNQRGLIQVKGVDASKFLQGLVTNDMKSFENNETGIKVPCMYAIILSVQGDVRYDVIIYNMNGQDAPHTNFFLECDKSGVDELTKLFAMYRIRKKVELNNVTDQFEPWVIYPSDEKPEKVAELITPKTKDKSKAVFFAEDPRLKALGWRLLVPAGIEPKDVVDVSPADPESGIDYKTLRYKLGVGEGVDDLPPGKCFPLECNADYLHGVNFHKGCYLGQELTARAHHTGVVRKRLMPLKFALGEECDIAYDTILENEKGKNVGRFVGKNGRHGLGMMRIMDCLSSKELKIKSKGLQVTTCKPFWWPHENLKQTVSA